MMKMHLCHRHLQHNPNIYLSVSVLASSVYRLVLCMYVHHALSVFLFHILTLFMYISANNRTDSCDPKLYTIMYGLNGIV